MEKNRITVLVAGQKFTIISEESEKYVIDLASKIDARITALTLKNMTREKAAVLTALDFADDLEKDKKETIEIREQIKDYIKTLSDLEEQKNNLTEKLDKLTQELETQKAEKKKLEEQAASLQQQIDSFRIESEKTAKTVAPIEEEVEPIENTEPPAEREETAFVTDDGDLSFDISKEKAQPAPSKKKKHSHQHEDPYRQNFMKKQEEKGYTPLRQYSLFEDEPD